MTSIFLIREHYFLHIKPATQSWVCSSVLSRNTRKYCVCKVCAVRCAVYIFQSALFDSMPTLSMLALMEVSTLLLSPVVRYMPLNSISPTSSTSCWAFSRKYWRWTLLLDLICWLLRAPKRAALLTVTQHVILPFPTRLCGRIAFVSKSLLGAWRLRSWGLVCWITPCDGPFLSRIFMWRNALFENCILRFGPWDFVPFRKIELDFCGSMSWNAQPGCLEFFNKATDPFLTFFFSFFFLRADCPILDLVFCRIGWWLIVDP